MAAESPWPTSVSDYIGGHLGHYTLGEQSSGPTTTALHLDTLVMSLLLGGLAFYGLSRVAAAATVRTPSKIQIFCEMLFDFFNKQVRDLFPNAPPIVGPLAVTIFIWVLLMNTMDMVPVDILTTTSYLLTGAVAHFKLVPTTDLSLTAALAVSVFAMTVYYNLKVKGVGGLLREMFSAPFGIWFAPVNFLLRCVEEIAKPLSLSMRLFGNLFAAEMIFLLIAGLTFIGPFAFILQPLFGGPWAIYHILVVPLQAYLFAVLTVVYLAMAHEKH